MIGLLLFFDFTKGEERLEAHGIVAVGLIFCPRFVDVFYTVLLY